MRRTALGVAAVAERVARRQTVGETIGVLLTLAVFTLFLLLGVSGAEAQPGW